ARIMSLWKKISLGVVIVILLLLGSVAFLVGTTSGLHLVFKAADRWVPGLDIGKVTGGWRDLTLSDVRYEQPGVAVKAHPRRRHGGNRRLRPVAEP
ncbi:hypothetical protein, partial [Pseudomonas aeruginosa]|uniref:hypothetical protein n=1 Tax=Pseudomonas aeruginosa TaxID=287 RepID=UPI003D18CFDC